MKLTYLPLCLAGCVAITASAQPIRHLDEVHTPRIYEHLEDWLGRAAMLRMHILVSAGLHPMPERTPLSPRVGVPLVRSGYTIQTVALETLPGFYLTGNLYRPEDGDARYPAVLSPHGHWQEGRFEDSDLASVPGRAIELARRGYVVFSYSMLGYNETAEVIPHRFAEPLYELWGFTPMGLQLWNSIRALDFLAALPDVDSTRIGITGASGGATQTFMLTAVDDRIKVAAPVNMISAHMQGGCICENAPLLRLDANNIEIGALAAPRPLLMVSTTGDWTANSPSVEYPAIRSIYELFVAEERIHNVHLDYPHNFNQESREVVYGWFDRWLMGVERPTAEEPFEVDDPSVLHVDLPEAAVNLATLFQTFRGRAEKQLEEARPSGWRDLIAYRDQFGTAFRHVFHEVPDAESPSVNLYLPEGLSKAAQATLIVHTRPTAGQSEELTARLLAENRMVFTLLPYAHTFTPPDSIAHWTTYNPTTVARRVNEIRRAVDEIQARPDVAELDLVGLGAAGPWTFLARALVDDIRTTRIDFDGFESDSDAAFVEELFVPLLRRAGDFRTAAALIAPDHLEIRSIDDEPLREWIREIYSAVGAAEMLVVE